MARDSPDHEFIVGTHSTLDRSAWRRGFLLNMIRWPSPTRNFGKRDKVRQCPLIRKADIASMSSRLPPRARSGPSPFDAEWLRLAEIQTSGRIHWPSEIRHSLPEIGSVPFECPTDAANRIPNTLQEPRLADRRAPRGQSAILAINFEHSPIDQVRQAQKLHSLQ
jgi:hypothetical protein